MAGYIPAPLLCIALKLMHFFIDFILVVKNGAGMYPSHDIMQLVSNEFLNAFISL